MNKPLVMLCAICASSLVHAKEFMVDQADSLDFQGFHKAAEEKEATKQAAESSSKKYSTNPSVMAANGEFFVVSERYSPIISGQTRYSAFSVTNVLHERMAQHCPDGFEILRQWSVPVEHDFLLHYGFTCLTIKPQ